jgi:anoctamin-1
MCVLCEFAIVNDSDDCLQNVVSLVMICVEWMIPDVPAKLKNQIRREAYLTNEIIIRHETNRAKQSACKYYSREISGGLTSI